jgi:beta-glucanase (GH16 family)
MRYSGGDEFNGTSLDKSKWINSFPWGRNYSGTCYQEYMTDGQNFQFDNGVLKLIAKEEYTYAKGVPYESNNFPLEDGLPNLRGWNYTSGMIFSKKKYKYGLFEIRFKPPVGRGFWPAFWLFGGNPDEEFDIFEYKGETPNRIHINVHSNGTMEPNSWVTANGNFSDGFNTMMGEWSPNFALWYLNGKQFQIWLGDLNFQANIIANLGIANDAPCAFSPGPNNSTPFPSIFEIDYIRVWTRLECNQTITISNYNQTSTDPTVITGENINVTNMALLPNQSLSLIATNQITIGPGTNIEGDFEAKIVNCPGPKKKEDPTFNKSNTAELKIISSLPDYENKKSNNNIDSLNKPILYTKIFPNPSKGTINIEFEGNIDNSNIRIEIVNSSGQSVFLKESIMEKQLKIDISQFSKGIYYLMGTFDGKIISEKIILE